MNKLRNQSGVALMIVLSAMVFLTAMAAEFAYNTNVNYNLALNERDRLKAEYLAMSAYQFMLVEMKFDKVFRKVVEQQNLGQFLTGSSGLPLCQQFPLSTQLIRAVFLGVGGEEGMEGAAESILPEELTEMISISQREGAEQFLDFVGDFEGECIDENSKINLNAFAAWRPDKMVTGKLNEYDQYKEFLVKFFSKPEYEELFEKADVKPQDVVRNIADWIDTNERINEPGGVMGGPEDSLYERAEAQYPLKNGKFTTPDEIFLVEGVLDDWFFHFKDRFTIYGDEKVDVCSAESDVVAALIIRYLESKPDAPPLNLGDEETMQKLLDSVANGCMMGGTGDQLKRNISQSLDNAVAELSGREVPLPGTPGAQPAQTGSASTGFGQFISTSSNVFTLKMVGIVGDIAVTIRATINVKDKNPKNWKILYWRVY
jgi:general secretion pathway protein K